MSHQLALSSLFSVLALASLCLAVGGGVIDDPSIAPSASLGVQAELAPGLHG